MQNVWAVSSFSASLFLLQISSSLLQHNSADEDDDSDISEEYRPSSEEDEGGVEEADSDEDYTSISEGSSSGKACNTLELVVSMRLSCDCHAID